MLAAELNKITLQRIAYEAAAHEAAVSEDFLNGECSEAYYTEAMAAADFAVRNAISQGVSAKDLPAC